MNNSQVNELLMNDLVEMQQQLDELEIQLTNAVLTTCAKLIETQSSSIQECEEKLIQLEKRMTELRDKKQVGIVKPFRLKYS